ncbi:MAG: DEAD/DEAH box helicase family protein [Propionibacterium freudenreichii]
MGNFDFITADWPQIHNDCARAESYVITDPRSACIYARRSVETLVRHLYFLLDLAEPYRDDLVTLINEPAFRTGTKAPDVIVRKLNLLRKLGNTAVHESRDIPRSASHNALRELFHVVVWAAYNFSTHPDQVPVGKQFDAKLAAQSAPLPREAAAALIDKFRAADERHREELAARDNAIAELEAERTRLLAKLAAAQAAKTQPDDHDYKESETRDAYIDLLLHEAGWALDNPRDREFPVVGMPNESGKGFVDYVLWGEDGLPLGLVEAKRTRRNPEEGQHQAKLYADSLEQMTGQRPVIFYTNGYQHTIWDDGAGYPPRQVGGFYTADELALAIRRRTARKQLTHVPVNGDIAGRPYQRRAIAAIDHSLDHKQRSSLLVMATGSGKTRVTIALIDQLAKAGWVKRALFLADRTALVNQAVSAFKQHLPNTPTVNLLTEKATDGRVYVSTYPTMLNLINEVDHAARRFGPGYFDLVVVDEAHRSVYAKYGEIFAYFDSLLVGLTATPKDQVDHNTYRLFELEPGVPTDAYSLAEAVADGYLVPAQSVSISSKFLRQGARYDELSEAEKDRWDSVDWGDDGPPDEVDAAEMNKYFFNADTVDKVLATVMERGHKVASGDRLGKTIIFAKSQAHAMYIKERFDAGWPEFAGNFASVITHSVDYAQDLINNFSNPDAAPHIAISVDMLDTGINVPEVVNLVFFKPVYSKTKFWQMIGRGTRLSPDLYGPGKDKDGFFVFDFCGNLEFFNQDLPETDGATQKSLTQRLFESRLRLIGQLDRTQTEPDLRASTAESLHHFVGGMSMDNVIVRPHRRAVERFATPRAWESLTTDDTNEALSLAGLPSSVIDTDEQAKRFDLLMLTGQLAVLEADQVALDRVRTTGQAIADNLKDKTAIPAIRAQAERLEELASDEWWVDVTLPMLELARLRIRGLVRFQDKKQRNPVYVDFEDIFTDPKDVPLPTMTPSVDIDRFRDKVQAYLREHQDNVALQRLRRNRPLTSQDITVLEQLLTASGADRDAIDHAAEQQGGLGRFIRSLVGLDRAAATEAFSAFLDKATYSEAQIRFVELIIDELTHSGVMEPRRLFESPYTDDAPAGPTVFFPDPEIDTILDIIGRVNDNATPEGVA